MTRQKSAIIFKPCVIGEASVKNEFLSFVGIKTEVRHHRVMRRVVTLDAEC